MRRVRVYLALAITAVWAISYPVAVATGKYVGFEVSTPVMIIAATFLLGSEFIKRNGNGRR